jgi:lycopene beta-cyclase
MVHPASGYQISRGLRAAARLAAALPLGADSATLTRIGRRTVWSDSARLNRSLHLYGLDVLLGLDLADTRDFFDTFFGLGGGGWRTMLDADAFPLATAGVMTRMLTASPWSVRRALFSTTAARRALARLPAHEPDLGS